MTPLHDHVVVQVLEDEERVSPGGIILHHVYEKPTKAARVVATGPGRRPWKDAGGEWHAKRPTPEHIIDTWSSRGVPSTGLEPGDVVVYEDHRTLWHTGRGEWPEAGDEALIPADAVLMVADTAAEALSVEVARIGVTR